MNAKLPLKVLTTILIIIALFCPEGYAIENPSGQNMNRNISISFQEETIASAIRKIKKQTGIPFAYDPEALQVEKLLTPTLNFENTSLRQILDKLLTPVSIGYREVNNTIVLHKIKESRVQEERTVTGKVTDENGEGLPGVTVVLKGTSKGVSTDVTGHFSLLVPDGKDTLVISFVGYQSKEVLIGAGQTINIKLVPDSKALEEVVVVGYGTQKKVNITGSVATVDAEFLENRPVTNASQALQGVSGVYVNQSGGQPGADGASIQVRGVGSLNGSGALVLVDGVEYSLKDVNPNDIESISVLKDAASAAIYGNRAANGVILITTKKGQKGRTQVEYNNYFGWQHTSYLPDVVWNSVDYLEGKNRALANEGKKAEYTDEVIAGFRDSSQTNPDVYPNTNWFDVMFRPAPIQEHNLRISGGSDQISFSSSLGYLNQEGVLIGTSAKKYSLSTNIQASITEKLKVNVNLSSNYWRRNEPPQGVNRMINYTYRTLPIQAARLENGAYGDMWVRVPGHNVFRNPLAMATEGYQHVNSERYLANISAEYKLPFDIVYKINGAINKYNQDNQIFVPQVTIENPKTNTTGILDYDRLPRSVRNAANNNLNTTLFNTLNWKKSLKGHNIAALLGYSRETFYTSNFSAYIEGFLGNELTEINAGTINKEVSGTSNRNTLASYFGRLNYDFKDKYLLEANFRYDGSSRFAQDNRWGLFPSFSVGWRLDQESFLQDVSQISGLKLRASWGQLGSQNIPDYRYVNLVDIGENYSFNNTVVPGAAVNTLSDPNLSWEETTITNLGLDAGFFNNRVNVTVDAFNKKTSGILRPVSVPAQVGNLIGPVKNIGNVVNRGFEIGLNYRNSIGEFNYDFGTSVSYVQNEVTKLNGETIISGRNITKEGYAIDSWYLLDAVGIFQTGEEIEQHAYQGPKTQPGDIKYRDVDGNNVIDNNDRIIIGSTIPKYTYNFNVRGEFKGIELSMFFQGVKDIDSYPTGNFAEPYNNGAGVTKEWLTDSWSPDNPGAPLPRLTTRTGYSQNFQNSTFWLEDASYLRLKNIQLGYTLPQSLTERWNISRVHIFVNGQNLLTFSKFKTVDPERSITRSNIYDYPTTKIFTTGLNVKF
ncbi:TonB-dependent receptor [Pontibacter korlensis]